MTPFKTMTPRRWAIFRRHVLPGSQVRGVVDGVEKWRGIVLENYPYGIEEYIERECEETNYLKKNMKQLHQRPILRLQTLDSLDTQTFSAASRMVQYLVDGHWLSFEEVMQRQSGGDAPHA